MEFGNDDASQIDYQGPALEKLLQEARGFRIHKLIFWRPAFSSDSLFMSVALDEGIFQ